jgi:hypothetical protein
MLSVYCTIFVDCTHDSFKPLAICEVVKLHIYPQMKTSPFFKSNKSCLVAIIKLYMQLKKAFT